MTAAELLAGLETVVRDLRKAVEAQETMDSMSARLTRATNELSAMKMAYGQLFTRYDCLKRRNAVLEAERKPMTVRGIAHRDLMPVIEGKGP